ncbi:hypothetical protein HJFPF1_07824 [Paramyrothecium foliicola]|nr:hypothetical protein HJFPF1_07824 [Paramyrothecium foliicola]
MASESDKQQPGDAAAVPADALTVNLQIVSPSVGVNRPLLFPGLPGKTTIKQLKEKIRQTLPLQPADENQRLIHRGRALIRETDTLLEIFGQDTLRNPEQQTIHLVIRETGDSPAASSTGARARSLSPANPVPNLSRQHLPQQPPVVGPQVPPGFTRRNVNQSTPNLPLPRGSSPARPPTAEQTPGLQGAAAAQHAMAHQQAMLHHHQQQQFHHQHQSMTQWLTQLQRETMARTLINQNQRNRAQLGMRGIGDAAGANEAAPPEPSSGRASPAPSHTIVREAWGPNGRTYQVETVIRRNAPNPQQGLSPTEVQNILRGADASQATAAMTTAMQRSASGASLHNRPLTQPGVTNPIGLPALGSRPPSGRATPDLGYRFATNSNNASVSSIAPAGTRQGLEVYILSSPEGPRALLVNNNTAETYYTPMARSQPAWNSNDHIEATQQAYIQQLRQMHQRWQQNQQQLSQQQPQQQETLGTPPVQTPGGYGGGLTPQDPELRQLEEQHLLQQGAGQVLQPHNNQPPIPPMMVQIGPHIWMLFRLAFAVWLFSSPALSWTKWLIMVFLAIFTFIMSTGVLNGLVDRVWQPAARHLENLIRPLEARPRREGANANGQGAQQHGELDPAQMAARLLAEQRGRESWVAGQVRRLERAGLLFLASIAPGVAERHIANLEAEARAERERIEAEAAAARAAAEAAAAEQADASNEAGAAGEDSADRSGEANSDTRPQETPPGDHETNGGNGGAEAEAHREPLIAL